MIAGLIAAGRGERLASGGISVPKPLVPVGGEALITRVIRAAHSVGAECISCVINDIDPAVGVHLQSEKWPIRVNIVQKTTKNSLESFFMLAPLLREPFLLFTVDAVFRFSTLRRFLQSAYRLRGADGVLALVKDRAEERPLRVIKNHQHRIERIGEGVSSEYITAGFYWFQPSVFDYRHLSEQRGLGAFREYLALLCEAGYRLCGITVGAAIDVDRPEDIARAEAFLKRRPLEQVI